ncbi:MAG: NAD-dependent epimerase/dehydratase family protein [Bacteroidales bacterium]|nr:NAD-dependent epimerase/dehydratase family protein [Bacteroidales bacterium]MBN2763973.1 NAD-dependent epimerase/dehydratase family protein [Bacteroidales bacterium]
MERILIIGASGQIGSELTLKLRELYGHENVFATDVKDAPPDIKEKGPFQLLDVMDDKHLIHFVIRHKITQIYHLAAVLSGNAEKLPVQAWHINMDSLMNILEVAKLVEEVKKVFWPSSIAVFGATTPRQMTPQITLMEPSTVYGVSKLAGERWCEYYYKRYGVDIRSLRYPGLISHKTEPGGGTTDWAVEIYYEAVKKKQYTSFVNADTIMPMMFMDDAIKATISLMEAGRSSLTTHSAYNISGLNLSPAMVAEDIKRYIPDFSIEYLPDFRQHIADTWPQSVDDSDFRHDIGWQPAFALPDITDVMIDEIRKKIRTSLT